MDIEFVVFFACVALVIIVPTMLKHRTKRAAFEIIARALERGQTLDPDAVARLMDEKLGGDRRRNTLATGVILAALAIGLLGGGAVLSALERDAQLQDFLVPAIILAALSCAFLLLAKLDRPNSPR